MGDFTLGCLLGQYDRAQSFDVASVPLPGKQIGAWNQTATHPTSWYFVPTGPGDAIAVHSSAQALHINVESWGAILDGVLRYTYSAADDYFARCFPDVATHVAEGRFWARTNADLGFFMGLDGVGASGNQVKVNAVSWREAYYSKVADVTSSLFMELDVHSAGLTPTGAFLSIDDVLVCVDPVVLYPDYGFLARQELIRSQFRARSGQLFTHVFDRYFAWEVPLRYLSNSHAALVNWWWQNQFNLLFTLDSSDAESARIVRITNEQQPIGGKIAPYGLTQEGWQGVLRLESIGRGELAF